MNGSFAVWADVAVVAFHSAAFEWQCVEWLFAGDAQLNTSSLPLEPVGVDVAAPAALVGDQVCEFVFEGTPEFLGFAVAEFRIEFDGAVRPPRPPGSGLHAGVP